MMSAPAYPARQYSEGTTFERRGVIHSAYACLMSSTHRFAPNAAGVCAVDDIGAMCTAVACAQTWTVSQLGACVELFQTASAELLAGPPLRSADFSHVTLYRHTRKAALTLRKLGRNVTPPAQVDHAGLVTAHVKRLFHGNPHWGPFSVDAMWQAVMQDEELADRFNTARSFQETATVTVRYTPRWVKEWSGYMVAARCHNYTRADLCASYLVMNTATALVTAGITPFTPKGVMPLEQALLVAALGPAPQYRLPPLYTVTLTPHGSFGNTLEAVGYPMGSDAARLHCWWAADTCEQWSAACAVHA